ncbi:MAG: PASTA domain-containing protein, partial [Lachnospiraceae bacterium]|nr:PASTA domain-containing protein [Lachnospiraceae bacterium]
QPPTEPPTQPPTEPPTQPPTEPPTQPPTEPPTQPPTEPPTEPDNRVEMPALMHVDYVSAAEVLERLGLTAVPELVPAPSPDFKIMEVCRQQYDVGTKLEPGTTVLLHVVGNSAAIIISTDIVSKSPAEARVTLGMDGLVVAEEPTWINHEYIPYGQVVDTYPGVGTVVDRGSRVTLILSLGPAPKIEVPDITGASEAEALAALKAAGLRPGSVSYEYSDSTLKDRIIRQTPGALSQTPADTRIDFVMSLGRPVLPDLAGRLPADARGMLEERGLRVGSVTEIFSSRIEKGRVVYAENAYGEALAADSFLKVGETVNLMVSKGPEGTVMPDLTDWNAREAQIFLQTPENGEFEVVWTNNTEPNETDVVVSTLPKAGETVAFGTKIRLTYGASIEVPDVTGMTTDEAREKLLGAGLKLEYPDGDPEGDNVILTMSPEAGTLVGYGRTVSLTYEKALYVPDVTTLTVEKAQLRLYLLGLIPVLDETASGPAMPDAVVTAMDPPAGELLLSGSSVTLYYENPELEAKRMIDVRDMKAQDARTLLEQAASGGFRVVWKNGTAPGKNDLIIASDPAPGEEVTDGMTVTLTYGAPIAVRNVVGMTAEEAEEELRRLGFAVTYPDGLPQDSALITAMEPAAGTTVGTGREIALTWGSAVEIPDLENMNILQAQILLYQLGLVPKVNGSPDNAALVTATVPEAGTLVNPGSQVTLEYEDPEPQEGPSVSTVLEDLTDRNALQAKELLEDPYNGGFTVVWEGGEAPGAGAVITAMSPAPGTRVAFGSTVTLTFGSPVTVPQLTGKTASEAQAQLMALGLIFTYPDGSPSGEVFITKVSPAPGTLVGAGRVVELTYRGSGRVPAVAGMTLEQAQIAVYAAGLKPVINGTPAAGALATGTDPEVGALLQEGSSVTILWENPKTAQAPADNKASVPGSLTAAAVSSPALPCDDRSGRLALAGVRYAG